MKKATTSLESREKKQTHTRTNESEFRIKLKENLNSDRFQIRGKLNDSELNKIQGIDEKINPHNLDQE